MRLRILSVCLAGVLGLLAARGGWADPPRRVALLPIVVHSAEEDSLYLSDGLGEMISARLERAGGVSVIRLQSNSRSTTKPSVAAEAGRAAGADYVVFGSFTQFGSGASLDVQCARVGRGEDSGDTTARRVFIQSGTLAEIIPKLDDLTDKIARYLAGEEPSASAPGSASAPREPEGLVEVHRRLDALERAIYGDGLAAPRGTSEAAGGEGRALETQAADAEQDEAPLR